MPEPQVAFTIERHGGGEQFGDAAQAAGLYPAAMLQPIHALAGRERGPQRAVAVLLQRVHAQALDVVGKAERSHCAIGRTALDAAGAAQPQHAIGRRVRGRDLAGHFALARSIGVVAPHVAGIVAHPDIAFRAGHQRGKLQAHLARHGGQAVGTEPVDALRSADPQVALAVLETGRQHRATDTVQLRQALVRCGGTGALDAAFQCIGVQHPQRVPPVIADRRSVHVRLDHGAGRRRGTPHLVIAMLKILGPDRAIGRLHQRHAPLARPRRAKVRFAPGPEIRAGIGADPGGAVAREQDLEHAQRRQPGRRRQILEAPRARRQHCHAVAHRGPDRAVGRHLDMHHAHRLQAAGFGIGLRAILAKYRNAAHAVAHPQRAVGRRGQRHDVAGGKCMAVHLRHALEMHAIEAEQAGGRGDPQPAVVALGELGGAGGRAIDCRPRRVRVLGQQRAGRGRPAAVRHDQQ